MTEALSHIVLGVEFAASVLLIFKGLHCHCPVCNPDKEIEPCSFWVERRVRRYISEATSH